MKRIGLLTSFAALALIMPTSIITISGCSTGIHSKDITEDSNVLKVESSAIQLNNDVIIKVTLKDGYVVDGFNTVITVGDKTLKYTDCDFDIQNNVNNATTNIIIDKNVVKSTDITTKFVSMEKPNEEYFAQTSDFVGIIELPTQYTSSSTMVFQNLQFLNVKGVAPLGYNHVESSYINNKPKFYVGIIFEQYTKSFLTNFTISLSYKKDGQIITENFKNVTFKYNYNGIIPIGPIPKEYIYDENWHPVSGVEPQHSPNTILFSSVVSHVATIDDPSMADVQSGGGVTQLFLKKRGKITITETPETSHAFSPRIFTINIIEPKIKLVDDSEINEDQITQGYCLDCLGTGGECGPTLVNGAFSLNNAYVEKMSLNYESNKWKFIVWGGLVDKQKSGSILYASEVQDQYQSVIGYIQLDIRINPNQTKTK